MSAANEPAGRRTNPGDDDPLAQIAAMDGVADAVADARKAVDRLLGHRILRRRSSEVSTESALRAARGSAALEGVEVSLERLRGDAADAAAHGDLQGDLHGGLTGDPDGHADGRSRGRSDGHALDPAVQGALRVSAELGSLTETWRHAPRQVLARLHVLAAADAVDAAHLGRPRTEGSGGPDVPDPLKLGPPPSPGEVAVRLDALSSLLVRPTTAPALVVGALVHGELAALRPFGWGDGIIARAAERLTFVERGLDPKSLTAPEVGHAELAGEYAEALRGYMSGTPEGLVGWIRHCADAVVVAARDSIAICEAFMRG